MGGIILVEQWSHNHKGCTRDKCPWYTKKRRRGGGVAAVGNLIIYVLQQCVLLKRVVYFICDTFFTYFLGDDLWSGLFFTDAESHLVHCTLNFGVFTV